MRGSRRPAWEGLNGYLLDFATAQFERALNESHTEMLLGDIAVLEDSRRIPLNSRDRALRKGSYPYYGASGIMDYVDDYLFDGIRILLGEDGTVIGNDGKPILQYVWGKYWVNNHAHVLRASSSYPLEAIYIALSRTTINHIVTGAVQMKISQKNMKALQLTMPGPDLISDLSTLFQMYRQNSDENKKLETLRNSLLPKLMSGEIDVSKVDLMQLNSHLADRLPLLAGNVYRLHGLFLPVRPLASSLLLEDQRRDYSCRMAQRRFWRKCSPS